MSDEIGKIVGPENGCKNCRESPGYCHVCSVQLLKLIDNLRSENEALWKVARAAKKTLVWIDTPQDFYGPCPEPIEIALHDALGPLEKARPIQRRGRENPDAPRP